MRMALFLPLLFSLSSAALAKTPAEPQMSCDPNQLVEAGQYTSDLTNRLRVANFRGDIKEMTRIASKIERFMDQCLGQTPAAADEFSCIPQQAQKPTAPPTLSDEQELLLGSVCDYECHAQLARYHLFMSGDFLYLSNKENTDVTSQTELLDLAKSHADLCGMTTIERGIRVLNRQNNVDVSKPPEASKDQGNSPFETWVRKNFNLQKLRIRLLMASGDLSYQATSDQALKKMLAGVDEALDEKTVRDNTLKMSYARYKAALWSTIELKTDIPNMPRFDDLKAVVSELDFQSKRRIQSIEKGRLYLDIDPESFSSMDTNELVQKLQALKEKVKVVESAISHVFESGQGDKDREAQGDVDEARAINSMQVNVEAQKIARLQEMAEVNRNELEGKLQDIERQSLGIKEKVLGNDMGKAEIDQNIASIETVVAKLQNRVSALQGEKLQKSLDINDARQRMLDLERGKAALVLDTETLAYRKEMRRLEFDLRRTLDSMASERKQIDSVAERDLIGLNRGRIKEEQARYQWLINFEITNLNLDLQIKSLGAQIVSFSGNIESAFEDGKSLQIQGRSNQAEFQALEAEFNSIAASLKSLFFRKHVDLVYGRVDTRNKICAAERQMAYLGVKDGEMGYLSYGEGNGFLKLNELTGSGTTSLPPAPILKPESEAFAYKLFERDDFPESCQEKKDELLKLAGVRWGSEDNPGDFANLTEASLPLLANYTSRSSNPVEALANQSLKQTSDELRVDLESLLAETNKTCGFAPVPYTAQTYYQAMCGVKDANGTVTSKGLRQQAIDKKLEYQTFLQKCVHAATPDPQVCAGFDQTVLALTKDLSAKNEAFVEQQITTMQNSIQRLQDFILWMQTGDRAIKAVYNAVEAAIGAATMVASSAAALPKITTEVGASGMGAHAVTTITYETAKSSEIALDTLKFMQNLLIGQMKDDQALMKSVQELDLRIADLNDKLLELRKEKTKIEVADKLTLAELSGRRVGVEFDAAELRLQNDSLLEDCNKSFAEWQEQIKGNVLEHARLVNQIKQQNAQAQSIDYEIARYKASGEEVLAKQEQVRLRIASLNQSVKKLRKDATRAEWQIENAVEEMCMIDATKTSIADKNSVLTDKIELALKLIDDAAEKNILALQDIQKERIEKTIRNSETETAALLEMQQKGIDLANAVYANSLGTIKSQSEVTSLERMLAQIDIEANKLDNVQGDQKLKIQQLREQVAQLAKNSVGLNQAELKLNQDQLDFKVEANKFQQATHGQILSLKDGILQEVQTILEQTDGQKKGVILRTQQAIEAVSMGVPEYLEAKKRYMQQANFLLNALRSRLNMSASLNSKQPLLTNAAYLRNSFELDTTIDTMLSSIEEHEVALVKAPTTTININQSSGFYQELLSKGVVRFEIAPLAGTDAETINDEMNKRGYFTLWADTFRYPNLRLVDMMVSMPNSCTGANVNYLDLSHLGSGYVFLPTDTTGADMEPVLVASQGRIVRSVPLYSEKDTTWSAFLENWKFFLSGNVLLRKFDEKLREMNNNGSNRVSGVLTGLPVSGVYEMRLEANTQCMDALRATDLRIHFNMTRDEATRI